jgi:hypothetical protein
MPRSTFAGFFAVGAGGGVTGRLGPTGCVEA